MNADSRRGYERATERAFGLCESCGRAQAQQVHHRLHRSHGGGESPSNLLHLCQPCHGDAHTASDRYVIGVSIRSGKGPEHEPRNRPVLYRGRWVFLTADGGIQEQGKVEF